MDVDDLIQEEDDDNDVDRRGPRKQRLCPRCGNPVQCYAYKEHFIKCEATSGSLRPVEHCIATPQQLIDDGDIMIYYGNGRSRLLQELDMPASFGAAHRLPGSWSRCPEKGEREVV